MLKIERVRENLLESVIPSVAKLKKLCLCVCKRERVIETQRQRECICM